MENWCRNHSLTKADLLGEEEGEARLTSLLFERNRSQMRLTAASWTNCSKAQLHLNSKVQAFVEEHGICFLRNPSA